jgi:hypothetical protein
MDVAEGGTSERPCTVQRTPAMVCVSVEIEGSEGWWVPWSGFVAAMVLE